MRRSLPKGGPDFLRCVGETTFVAQAASIARAQKAPTQIAGIVAHADLRLAEIDDVLDAHEEAAEGLFRGIRHAGASAGDIEGQRSRVVPIATLCLMRHSEQVWLVWESEV